MSNIERGQLVQILLALTSADNHGRHAAEVYIKNLQATHPIQYLTLLVDVFCNVNDDQTVIMMSGILLKNFFNDRNIYSTLLTNMPQEQIESIQKSILMRFGDPQFSRSTRNIAEQIIVAFAPKISEEKRNSARYTGFGLGNVPRPAGGNNIAWPGLIKQLVEVAGNPAMTMQLRVSCLETLSALTETLMQYDDFVKEIPAASQVILAAFEQVSPISGEKKNDVEYLKFASSAGTLVGNLFEGAQLYPNSFPVQPFCHQLASPFIGALEAVCTNPGMNDNEESRDAWVAAIQSMIEQDLQTFFTNTGTLQNLQNALFQVAQFSATNRLITSAEHNFQLIFDVAGIVGKTWFKTNKTLCTDIFNFCVKLMNDGLNELPANWKTTPTMDDETDDNEGDEREMAAFICGCSTIDSLGELTKGKVIDTLVLPILLEATQKVGNPAEWKVVAVAHGVITYCFASLKEPLTKQLSTLMNSFIIPSLSHSNDYIRYLAFMTCAQIATDLAPTFQEQYYSKLLPIAAAALHQNNDCPRIEEVAGIFISNFFDSLDTSCGEEYGEDSEENNDILVTATHYLTPVIAPLLNAFQVSLGAHADPKGKPTFVLHTQIRGLCDTCNVANKRILPHAAEILGLIQPMVRKYHDIVAATNYDFSTVRSDAEYRYDCKCLYYTIEVATIIFSHCPSDFQELRKNALDLAQFLTSLLENANLKPRDELLKFLLRGLCCMSEHLREHMEPLLPRVISKVLEYASMKCDYITDEHGDGLPPGVQSDQETYEDPDLGTIQMVRILQPGAGPRIIRIQQDVISTKELASNILFTLCDVLKGLMFEFVPQVAECALELLKFAAHGEVRENGALTIEYLVNVIKTARTIGKRDDVTDEAINGALAHLAVLASKELVAAMDGETDEQVLGRLASAFKEVVVYCPLDILSSPDVSDALRNTFDGLVKNRFDEINNARSELFNEVQMNPEGTEEALEEFEENIDTTKDVLGEIIDCIQSLLKAAPQVFSPWFLSTFATYLLDAAEEQSKRYTAAAKHATAAASAGKGKKVAAGKSKKSAAAPVMEELDPEQDPQYYNGDFVYVISLIGSFLEHATVEYLIPNKVLHNFFRMLCHITPLIDDENPLQATVWSLAVTVSSIDRCSNVDGTEWIKIVSPFTVDAQTMKPHEYVKLAIETAANFFSKTRYPDLEISDVDAAIDNIMSIVVRAIKFYDTKTGRWADAPLKELKFLTEKLTERLPIDGDEIEAKTVIYPHLICSLADAGADHPLLAPRSELRTAILEAFENMKPQLLYFGPATYELLQKNQDKLKI